MLLVCETDYLKKITNLPQVTEKLDHITPSIFLTYEILYLPLLIPRIRKKVIPNTDRVRTKFDIYLFSTITTLFYIIVVLILL